MCSQKKASALTPCFRVSTDSKSKSSKEAVEMKQSAILSKQLKRLEDKSDDQLIKDIQALDLLPDAKTFSKYNDWKTFLPQLCSAISIQFAFFEGMQHVLRARHEMQYRSSFMKASSSGILLFCVFSIVLCLVCNFTYTNQLQ